MKTILTLALLALVLPGGIFILIGLILRHRHQKKINHLAYLEDNTLRPKDIEPGIL